MTADVKLIPSIPEGSVVVLTGVSFRRETDDPLDDYASVMWDELRNAIVHVAGHDHFLLLHLPDDGSDVEVWGPDTDLEARLSALLAARGMKPRPEPRELRFQTWMGRPLDDKATRPDVPRRHCVLASATSETLCGLPTLGMAYVPDDPFQAHAGVGVVCSACAGQHKDALHRHHHDEKVDPPCGWCHTCGAYVGGDSGACPGCGAVDVEG